MDQTSYLRMSIGEIDRVFGLYVGQTTSFQQPL
jgi:hypothetical protein